MSDATRVIPAFSFSACQPPISELRYDTTERRDCMAKESALYQLMGVRMNGIMNDITNSDGEYQEIIRKSDEYP